MTRRAFRRTVSLRSSATLALIKAFCPGEASTLRQCRESEWGSLTFTGERIEIEYDLPDAATRKRAFVLVAFAEEASANDIPVRGWLFADIAAQVKGDVLHVEAVAIRD